MAEIRTLDDAATAAEALAKKSAVQASIKVENVACC